MQHLVWKMLSTIKNGLLARRKSIVYPYKIFCNQVLKVLYKEGYINGYRLLPSNSNKIEIFLKYNHSKPAIAKIVSVSKPGKRVYVSVFSLWRLNTSLHTMILSTPKGILSDKESRKAHLGGELLCIVQ